MWFEIYGFNVLTTFTGILHSVEMRLFKKLRKLWCYFKWYIYSPFWHWVYIPAFKVYRPIRRPIRRWKKKAIAAFWSFVDAVEKSPTTTWEALKRIAYGFRRFILGLPGAITILGWCNSFLRAYFKVVNFRRLLVVYILADMFVYHWSAMTADPDLRMWNLCVLTLFFNVLYILMDGADGKLRLYSQDFFTRWYIRTQLKVTPGAEMTPEQMLDPVLSRYIKFRHMRNAYLCIIGFIYTGQPLFRS